MSQELAVVEGTAVSLRDPETIVAEAKARAKVLMDIVKECHLSVRLGKKEHIQIEAWQTVASFYHCTAGAYDVEPIEIDGIKGAKARACVRDDHTNEIVSEAIAFCMCDEPNWANKPWFQVASMAQTRAMSKALANKFRCVAVLAGYSGTPAEEMIREQDGGVAETGSVPAQRGTDAAPTYQSGVAYPFKPHKGKDLADESITLRDLEWLAGVAAQNVNDPGKQQFRERNEELALAIQQELDRRHGV